MMPALESSLSNISKQSLAITIELPFHMRAPATVPRGASTSLDLQLLRSRSIACIHMLGRTSCSILFIPTARAISNGRLPVPMHLRQTRGVASSKRARVFSHFIGR